MGEEVNVRRVEKVRRSAAWVRSVGWKVKRAGIWEVVVVGRRKADVVVVLRARRGVGDVVGRWIIVRSALRARDEINWGIVVVVVVLLLLLLLLRLGKDSRFIGRNNWHRVT
jgi:hypothetical protein